MNRESNVFDRLIVFYIILQIFGILGGALIPIRIFIIVCIPAMLAFILKNKSVAVKYKYEIITFFIWIIWGIISLLWVYDVYESLKEIIYLVVHFLGFFLLVFFANRAKSPKDAIVKGWTLLFIFTLPIALIEIFFDLHLPVAYQTESFLMNYGNAGVFVRKFASVTYGNLNSYNTILTYIIPFVLSGLIIRDNQSSRISTLLKWILFLSLCYVLIINSSRAALICLFTISFIFSTFYIKNVFSLIGISLLLISVILFISFSNNEFLDIVFMRFDTQGFEDEGRNNMLIYGLDELIKSKFIGVGASNFTPTIEHQYGFLDTVDPHNFFLEVLVQYGIVIFILFIGLFVRIFFKNRKNEVRKYKFIIISSLCIYPILTIIDSSYLYSMSTWLFIASLNVIADKKYLNIQ